MKYLFQTWTVSLLRLSLKRHTETAIRATNHIHRVAEELQKALNGTDEEGQSPTFLLLLCNGYFTTLAGDGALFQEFKKNLKNWSIFWQKLQTY